MDSERFDALTRVLSSRRTALRTVLGGATALLGLAAPDDAAAHNPAAACRKLPNPARKRRCLQRAAAHRQYCHSAATVAAACAGKCGVWPDRCGAATNCTCPAPKTCLSNASCARPCGGGSGTCPTGCSCYVAAESTVVNTYCGVAGATCDGTPCSTTSTCPVGYSCVECGTSGDRCIALCQL